jgi:predicted amidohydrolase YtcJ
MSLDARVLAPRPADREAAILRGARLALSHGVTAVDEITSWPSILEYIALAESDRLPIRVTLHVLYVDLPRAAALGFAPGKRIGPRGRLAIGGIKLFADGSFGARTAALREPYADAPGARGLLLLDGAALAARIAEIERAGFRALVHVIGDAALDAALDGFEAARIGRGNPLGHRLEHVEMVPGDAALARLARLGLAVAAQPNFVGAWQGPGGLYETRLGPERARRLNPFASLIRAGVPVAFSSDAMPIDPLLGIRGAANHPDPIERVDALEAFRRYAEWGSRIAGDGDGRGRIAPGAPADFALLSASPEEIAAARVVMRDAEARDAGRSDAAGRARVLATFVDGALAFDAAVSNASPAAERA